jgi:hypothetical protein
MMKFTITTRVFLAVMVLSGVATGVLAMLFPDIAHGRFPSYRAESYQVAS